MKDWIVLWRRNFFAGLALVFPVALSVAIVIWLFGTVANFTDTLLFFVPWRLTHQNEGAGPVHWYWSLAALALALVLISLLGAVARCYMGKRVIETVEQALLKIPFFNKIYGTIRQVNEAFSSSARTSFRQVVLVEFPRRGHYSIGFVTAEQTREELVRTKEKVVSVFIPNTPNPTTGFLIFVPETEVTKLDMSVADGLKFVVSLGTITPAFAPSGGTESANQD